MSILGPLYFIGLASLLTVPRRLMRIALIVGAAICFFIGLRIILLTIAYHMAFEFIPSIYAAVAFVPLILLGPRSSTPEKELLFAFLGLTEVIVIGMASFVHFVINI